MGDGKSADAAALAHVNALWRPYGLTLPFALKHKADNRFTAAAYWSKGDYALRLVQPLPGGEAVLYRLRGKDRHKHRHPSHDLLDAILAGRDDFPAGLTYTRRGGLLNGLRVGGRTNDPSGNSLRLLPSGPDRVGEAPVRRRPPNRTI